MRIKSTYIITSLLFLILGFVVKAQDKTISGASTSSSVTAVVKHKIMLIPFESRMYMSEIDMAINKETKLSAKQIKEVMRDAVNEQLYKKLKSRMQVIDLLEDSSKTQKDLANIYKYLSYDYQKVPSQDNFKAPIKEKDAKKIDKGQLAVEINSDARFMNAKIKSASLVPYLYGKYKTDLFLFINELDIKSVTNIPGDYMSVTNRKISVHYTIYTYDAKEVNSGLAEVLMPIEVNNPAKISSAYFSQIADILATRLQKAMSVKQ